MSGLMHFSVGQVKSTPFRGHHSKTLTEQVTWGNLDSGRDAGRPIKAERACPKTHSLP